MSILHIFSTLNLGGPQKRLLDLLGSDFGKDHKHFFIAMDRKYEALKAIPDHVDFEILKNHSSGSFFSHILSYRKTLKKIQPDLLLTYNWGAIEWGFANFFKIAGRHIHLEDGFGPEEKDKRLLRRNLFRCFVLKRADGVIVPSRVLEKIAKDEWKIDASKLHYIPNGIDLALYKDKSSARLRLQQEFGIPENAALFGTIAGLRPEKNLSRMIEAFAAVKSSWAKYLLIMGAGPEEAALKAKVNDMGLEKQITFTGHIDKPSDYLPGLDAFVLSSDTEQMPYSVVEAMASSLPILSVDVGDVKEMVSEENKGYICKVKSAEALSGIMNIFLTNRELFMKVGQANLKKAQDFSVKQMVKKHMKVYKK
jgi:glycosyltransferase involved in cell wall biosynthesis